MNILVVCESEKKARVHSRRIISKYLPQLGSQVWFGSISEEGAKELYKELLKKATKNMSVVCHRITSRSTRNVYFNVGSKKYFDNKGYYAFSFKKDVLNIELPENNFVTLLKLVGKLSGLLHDLGKSIQSFQVKIRGLRQTNIATDPIRHDMLSIIVILHILREHKKCSEIEILNTIKNFNKEDWGKRIEKVFDETENTIYNKNKINQLYSFINKWLAKDGEMFSKYPVLLSVAQVILGHHFSPKTNKDNDKDELSLDKYVHDYKRECHGENPFAIWGIPVWREDRWHDSICATLNEIVDHLSKNEDIIPESPVFMLYNRLIVRPAFVAADQNVSAKGKKARYSKDNVDLVPFANPYSKNLDGQMAQPLIDHLLDVARETQRNVRKLYALWEGRNLDFVDEIPRQLKSGDLPEQFAWQKKAQDIGKKINNLAGGSNFPFFGVMTASTGSGKTRCIPRFMSYLQGEGNIRFTLALGLRTLTEQSGRNYIDENEIGFQGNQDVSVLIGGSFYDFADPEENQKLDSMEVVEDESNEYIDIANTVLGGIEGTYIDPDSPFPKELAGPQGDDDWGGKGAKKAKMLQVPILVCTIDHLMAGLINPKADAAKILPRLITSDLVIDEIDCFDTKDIQALMQLIFYTAAAGRKVVVSSATISPVLCRAFFHQYKLGYDCYRQIHPKASNSIYTAWINDEKDLCHFKNLSTDEDIIGEYKGQTSEVFTNGIKALKAKPIRRKLDFIDISDCRPKNNLDDKHIEEAYSNISEKISQNIDILHSCYHATKDGKNLSVGIVRMTYTKHAYQVFNNLFDIDSQIGAKRLYVFYQSKLEDENLENVEYVLNKMLKRKSKLPEDDPIWQHEGIQKLIKENPNTYDFQIIVVSTPIEEVGRDHDFDWGIVEPTSIWSIIQMAGRIFRHRPYLELRDGDLANIVMLSHTFRDIFSSKKRPYEQPGPIDKYHILSTHDARKIFPEGMKKVIDSRHVMEEYESKPSGRAIEYDALNQIEHDRIAHGLIDDIIRSDIFSKSKTYLANYFNEKFPFRDSLGQLSVNMHHEESRFTFDFYWRGKRFSKEMLYPPQIQKYDKSKLLLPYFSKEYISDGKAQLSLYINDKEQLNNLTYGEKIIYAPEIGYVFI